MALCPLLFFHKLAHPPWNIMGSKVMQRIPDCYKNWAIYRVCSSDHTWSMLIWLCRKHGSSEYAWYMLIWLYIEHVCLSMCGACSSDMWLCTEHAHLTIHRTCLPGYALSMLLSTCIYPHIEEWMCFYFPDQNNRKYHHSRGLDVHNRNATIKKKNNWESYWRSVGKARY